MSQTIDQLLSEAMAGIAMAYGIPMPGGNRYYVNSTGGVDAAGYGEKDTPLATVDYAVGKCTANHGDMIVCEPGHAETLAGAAAIDLDCAGITVVCLGSGESQATFTFAGAVGADIDIDAANITWIGGVFIGSEDGLTGPFDVNAAGFKLIRAVCRDDGAENVIDWVVLDANADKFECLDCENQGTDTAGNDSFITAAGAAEHIKIVRLISHGDFAVANIDLSPAAVTDCLIDDCVLENANAVDVNIEGKANMTGWIRKCSCRIATDGQTTWINTPGNASLFENYGVNNNGETGKLIGTVSV